MFHHLFGKSFFFTALTHSYFVDNRRRGASILILNGMPGILKATVWHPARSATIPAHCCAPKDHCLNFIKLSLEPIPDLVSCFACP